MDTNPTTFREVSNGFCKSCIRRDGMHHQGGQTCPLDGRTKRSKLLKWHEIFIRWADVHYLNSTMVDAISNEGLDAMILFSSHLQSAPSLSISPLRPHYTFVAKGRPIILANDQISCPWSHPQWTVILIWHQLVQEVLSILKVGGTTLIHKPFQSDAGTIIRLYLILSTSYCWLGLQNCKFCSQSQLSHQNPLLLVLKQKGLYGKLIHHFAFKKVMKSLPKMQTDDDLIEQENLLIKEDLKKPWMPTGIGRLKVQEKLAKIAFVEGQKRRKNY